MRYLRRWVLHHERHVRDHRGRDLLGVYSARGGEAAGAAVEGVEAESGGWEIDECGVCTIGWGCSF